MNIIIAGAGAMGSRFAAALNHTGNHIILIDGWPANVNEVRFNGMHVNVNGVETVEHFDIYGPDEINETTPKADLIIVLVKSYQLDKTFESLKLVITDDTYVICVMNGIGHEDTIRKYVPLSHILLGTTLWTARLDGPGHPVFTGEGAVSLQCFDEEGKEKCAEFIDLLNKAGLNACYSYDLRSVIYEKACITGVLNGLTAILECNINEFRQLNAQMGPVAKQIIHEFAMVAAAEDIHQNEDTFLQEVDKYMENNADSFTTMYYDLIRSHRITEIEYMNGAISRKGRKYGIETPYCDLITALIHAKESLLNAF